MNASNEKDNDDWSRQQVQEFFAAKYPKLTELEMRVLMMVHTKNSCAAGIWCGSELSDWVALLQSERANAALEARISEREGMIFIDKNTGEETHAPYLQYRYVGDGLKLDWDDRTNELAALHSEQEGEA